MHLHGIAHLEDDLQVVVELRALVEHGAVRRHMHVEDAARHVLDLGAEMAEPLAILVLGEFPLGIPGRAGRAAAMQHLVAAQVRHFHLVIADRRRRLQHRVDLEEIVVAGRGDQRNVLAFQLFLGPDAPFAHALHHQLLEQLVPVVFVLRQRPVLLLGHHHGIEPLVARALDELVDFGLGRHAHGLAGGKGEPGLVRLFGDGHHRLARHVAAHHQDVGAVELHGVEELLEADVGSVQVGGEEDHDLLAAARFVALPEHVAGFPAGVPIRTSSDSALSPNLTRDNCSSSTRRACSRARP